MNEANSANQNAGAGLHLSDEPVMSAQEEIEELANYREFMLAQQAEAPLASQKQYFSAQVHYCDGRTALLKAQAAQEEGGK